MSVMIEELEHLKDLGYKYVATDSNGLVYAYKVKPTIFGKGEDGQWQDECQEASALYMWSNEPTEDWKNSMEEL